MTYDALIAQKVVSALLSEGIYVIGFFYPVVPKNEARIRVQISKACHSPFRSSFRCLKVGENSISYNNWYAYLFNR